MIDIHSHILPGLDDGARTLEQAVEMVRVAAEAGTTDLVASPHCNLDYAFDPAVVESKLAEVAEASGHAVRLHFGCDFHFYYENIQNAFDDPHRYTIGHRSYLLVEFPDLLIPATTREVFTGLLDRGIVPVITHPERNYLLQARLPQLQTWVDDGVLLQVTAQSFLGRFGSDARRFSEELMRRGMVHIVASDGHDPEDRPPRLDHAYRHIAKKWGEDWANALCVANPEAALQGVSLPHQPKPAAKSWYRFWV
ncbi:MAG TPA: CpsB/CapC family capsule biosynthesis tyrosine phosphatase [Bryobacteraceae bacterium]|nr:CpsB/CapC family capsule biosynthesis tyrosine phosphatase [Bryobacteraceae bacterium]